MSQDLKALSDEELMRMYQEGNDLAFQTLYGRHAAKVYGYLKTRLFDRNSLDDVHQLTFMKMHRARSHFDSSFPFMPWLFTICRSALVEHLRKQKRVHEESRQETDLEALGGAAPDRNPALPALDGLPSDQSVAIELRYAHDVSFEEIAKRLETSETNARQLVSRGIRNLKLLINGRKK